MQKVIKNQKPLAKKVSGGVITKKAVSSLNKQNKKTLVRVEPPGLLYKTISEEEAKQIFGLDKTQLNRVSIQKQYKHEQYTPSLCMQFGGMITGCGLGQIYGIASLRDTDACKQAFKEIMQEYAEKVKKGDLAKVGALLATLGQSYKGVWEYIEKFGFKQIHSYINYNHGETYEQRLYSYDLSRDGLLKE